jgi:hypothetical protein
MFAVQEASASVRSISLALWRRVVRSTSYVYAPKRFSRTSRSGKLYDGCYCQQRREARPTQRRSHEQHKMEQNTLLQPTLVVDTDQKSWPG